MKIRIIILIVLLAIIGSMSYFFGKDRTEQDDNNQTIMKNEKIGSRIPNQAVEPLIFNGLTYTAGSEKIVDASGNPTGLIVFVNSSSGTKVPVYTLSFDMEKETDVQEIYLTRLYSRDGLLVAVNERGSEFVMNKEGTGFDPVN